MSSTQIFATLTPDLVGLIVVANILALTWRYYHTHNLWAFISVAPRLMLAITYLFVVQLTPPSTDARLLQSAVLIRLSLCLLFGVDTLTSLLSTHYKLLASKNGGRNK